MEAEECSKNPTKLKGEMSADTPKDNCQEAILAQLIIVRRTVTIYIRGPSGFPIQLSTSSASHVDERDMLKRANGTWPPAYSHLALLPVCQVGVLGCKYLIPSVSMFDSWKLQIG